jgi:hypothetical protein
MLFGPYSAYPDCMEKRQVILIQMQPLLGEGLQRIFQKLDDVDLVCLSCTEFSEIGACLDDTHPDMVLLAGEKEDDQATHLISTLLKRYENIPIVWVELETTQLRLFTSHSLTANSTELINAIRENDVRHIEIFPMDRKSNKDLNGGNANAFSAG